MKTIASIVALLGLLTMASPATSGEVQDGTMDLLFIHHSCGGQLFADQGENDGEKCIYISHPNGGGLRSMLQAEGYQVNEASYGSIVGDDTDICHWREKFASQMARILTTQMQDELLPEGRSNEVVCFKSCFPNNSFKGEGEAPGDPDDCNLTVANAKATYRDLLPMFKENPEVLFVAFTAPPNYQTGGFKGWVKKVLKGANRSGEMAVQFNSWLTDRDDGWLAGYEFPNVVVFDHFGILTDNNESGALQYPSGNGQDSHPNSTGNQKSAAAFVPFLAAAVDGMSWPQP